MKKINQLTQEEQRYLYGYSDNWVMNNFKDDMNMEIVVIMQRDKHENGIIHSYLRDRVTGCCYDVRGKFRSNEEIIKYTDVKYTDDIEEYIFYSIKEFEMYLSWVDFEMMKEEYMV